MNERDCNGYALGSSCGCECADECVGCPPLCDCGYPDGSFACKIRHQGPPIIGWGKAAKE